MSTAHRPTWDPAQAREVKGGSRQYSSRDMAAHTKLKFRQPGQTATSDVAKRDLRAELLVAEHEARNKKRKAAGLPPLPFEDPRASKGAIEAAPPAEAEDEAANKRRKLLQEALELDRDDDDEDSDVEEAGKKAKKGGEEDAEGDAVMKEADGKGSDSEEEEDDDDDDDDDEDETAVLLRELEKIKRERAEEKARQEAAENADAAASREAEIAMGNPLLNLAAALGAEAPKGINTTAPGTFAVKRRWDDDLIFKNQAVNPRDKASGQFVNDLLRTEFHRKFMGKFIK